MIVCNGAPDITGGDMNLITTATVALALVAVLCFVEEEYRRPQNAKG